jgi:hypothetical protein
VVVKFHDHVQLSYEDAVGECLEECNVGPWHLLMEQFRGITIRRLFTAVTPQRLKKLVATAMRLDPTYHPPNFLTYFAVHCPSGMDPQAVSKALASWQTVEVSYVESGPTPPPQTTPDYEPQQEYLIAPPPANSHGGIDAKYAWGILGGDGGGAAIGLQFVDIEQGWTIKTSTNPTITADHEDLPAGIQLIHGANRDYLGHGTAVLGIVAAVMNGFGCTGITPNMAAKMLSSIWPDLVPGSLPNRVDAILAAIDKLSFGDVLLLEDQVRAYGYCLDRDGNGGWYDHLLPVEVEGAIFQLIRLGAALGIVIVEAAGNGGCDLDVLALGTNGQVLNPGSPQFRGDSGAIMVAAATSGKFPGDLVHAYKEPSNFGNRIDCFAWGEDIKTTGDGDRGTGKRDYCWFADTSGAAAIVAGAALAVQGIAHANLGYRFSPRQLRHILSDPTRSLPSNPLTGNTLSANSTYPSNPNADRIGVMPNLKKIIQALHLVPDVYLRDSVGDAGEPNMDPIWASPDVILRSSPVSNPQAAFGAGSGTENNDALGVEAQAGQDNYIYVRVRNRGGSDAANVKATVYWSPSATLVTPALWTRVGSTVIANVPAGDVLTVSDPITWPAAQIPGPGHYCFVGLIGNALDPEPSVPDLRNDWSYYDRFIRENNNVTMRNFNVVDNAPNAPLTLQLRFHGKPPISTKFVPLPFLITGPPDHARQMRLEVVAKLPPKAQVMVQVPIQLAEAVHDLGPISYADEEPEAVFVPVNPHGRTPTKESRFPAKFSAEAHLLVHIPEKFREHSYDLYIRQLYEGREVGRITWRLAPPQRRKQSEERR